MLSSDRATAVLAIAPKQINVHHLLTVRLYYPQTKHPVCSRRHLFPEPHQGSQHCDFRMGSARWWERAPTQRNA
jgi:hypothetical protein